MLNSKKSKDRRTGLNALLAPKSVAIIGASDDPSRIGGRPLRYMLNAGYAGPIYPVNPNREEVQGIKAYPSILEVPEAVDCAVIAVPAKIVAKTLEGCAAKGVKSAVIFSSGFAEMGPEGAAMQAQLSDISARTGIRIAGPNCLGILNFETLFFATFSSTGDGGYTKPGPVAIISQSGAYGTHIYAVARSWGLGISHVITTGNECDIDVAECIGWAAEVPEIKIIVAYAEGVKDGPALIRSLELARANNKPVIFMKVGHSAEGAAAAASHTASLAGSNEIYDAVFNQCGVHRANTTEEMLDIAYACTAGIYPTDDRIGLITISGGVGVLMADYASQMGLDVAPMPEQAQKKLKEALPFASPRNPVDATAHVFNDLSLIGKNFSIMLGEGKYNIAVAFFTVAAASPYIVEPLLDELNVLREQFPDRLIFLSLMGPPEIVARYKEAGYLIFEDPCRAIAAASALVGFGRSFAENRTAHPDRSLDSHPQIDISGGALSEWDSRDLLAKAGIPVGSSRLAKTATEATDAARTFDSPVAMKINGAEFSHKTEIGGVVLNIASPEEAGRMYDELQTRVKNHMPEADSSSVIVAPMTTGGIEAILGVQIDPVFGPAVLFGLGGVYVEVLNDVVLRLAPFDKDVAMTMINSIKGAKVLRGVRSQPPSDLDALADALVALSEFAAAHADQLESVDINPFVVLPQGQGAVALDCLVVPKGDHHP